MLARTCQGTRVHGATREHTWEQSPSDSHTQATDSTKGGWLSETVGDCRTRAQSICCRGDKRDKAVYCTLLSTAAYHNSLTSYSRSSEYCNRPTRSLNMSWLGDEHGLRVSCQTAKFIENQLKTALRAPKNSPAAHQACGALRAALYSWFCTMSMSATLL